MVVRNERGMEEAERWLKHQHRVYCSEGALWKGSPARELKPIATY
jgi:hypothetical protein